MNNRIVLFIIVFALMFACSIPQPPRKKGKTKSKAKHTELPLPVLVFTDTLDHRFVLTNKLSGLFSGHSKKENAAPDEGWVVDNTRILPDYQIFADGRKAERGKVKRFRRLPFGFERFYKNGMVEKFLMADSIDALVVQVENQSDISLSVQNGIRPVQISEQNPRFSASGKSSLEIYFTKVSGEVSRFWFIYNHSLAVDALTNETYRELLKSAAVRAKRKVLNIGNKTIDQAALWAGYSLDALTGHRLETGIARDKYSRERDTFISFSGALLLSGKFSTARNLLRNYASMQLTDKSRREYGRIMNRIMAGDVVYNSASVTWWYIRTLYDYYLFTGDKELITELFPVVRRAVDGALKHRCDDSFLLTHGEAETWMDAQKANSAWSPRGNRSVEIQALWYTALQLSAKMAQISHADRKLSTSWFSISRQLKRNFNTLFWDANREALYEHLNTGGQPDTSLRPNQIFAVTVPDVYGVEPLLSQQKQCSVAKRVTEALTLPSGVLTLWHKDRNFHPYHHYLPYYAPEAARTNGLIWTGLAGPVVASLIKFNQLNTAEEFILNESRQILSNNPPGSYAELLEPVLRPGRTEQIASGALTQIWGLAEYKQNLLQDILGYHPVAGDSLVIFKPRLTQKTGSVQTRVPYKNGSIDVALSYDEGTMDIILRSEANETIYGRLKCPGNRPAVDFMLQDSGAVFQYMYVPKAKPEIPPSKILREWSFTSIDTARHFPVLAAPEYTLLKARQIFLPPGENGYTLLFKRDALHDDHGENGSNVYPKNNRFKAGVLDLESITIYDMQDSWGFRVKLLNMTNNPAGNTIEFLAVAIRDESVSGKLKRDVERGARYRLPKERAYNRIIYAGTSIEIQDGSDRRLARYIPLRKNFPLAFTAEQQIRFKIPKLFLPGLNAKSRITILCGAQDDDSGAGPDNFRAVKVKTAANAENRVPAVYDRMDVN